MRNPVIVGVVLLCSVSGCGTSGISQSGLFTTPPGASVLEYYCATPEGMQPVWFDGQATSAHFGCATAYNALMQHVPTQTRPFEGTDAIMAVSAGVRYRKGETITLRETSLEVGGE